ncbi:MAG: uroporphyrinogen decarboxylase family protein [Planctomycetes bacterium]|nr:uroporphyrinogen decarboxylase family protein [Planctomycetota bacterium]
MNNRERVFATLGGNPVDRPPFTALLSLYGARLTDCPSQQYYTDPAAYARGQDAVRRTFEPDILFSPFFLAGEARAFGGKIKFFDHQPPNLVEPAITSIEQLSSLDVPDIDSDPTLVFFREAISQMAKTSGEYAAIAAILLNPMDLPVMIMGMDGWLQTVLFDTDGFKRMMDLTVPFFTERANALLEAGADCLVTPAAFLNPSVATRDIVERLALPILRDAFEQIQGPVFIHHVGSSFTAFLELFADLPHVIGIAVDHSDNLSEARTKMGTDMTLVGGLDGPNIWKLIPEQVHARCEEILLDRQHDPRFILATSGADVALSTPEENIRAMHTAAESFSHEVRT